MTLKYDKKHTFYLDAMTLTLKVDPMRYLCLWIKMQIYIMKYMFKCSCILESSINNNNSNMYSMLHILILHKFCFKCPPAFTRPFLLQLVSWHIVWSTSNIYIELSTKFYPWMCGAQAILNPYIMGIYHNPIHIYCVKPKMVSAHNVWIHP